MDITEVRDLLRSADGLSEVWFGVMRADNSRAWAACLFEKRTEPMFVIGGEDAAGANVRAFSLVLRLGRDAGDAQREAERIFAGVRDVKVENGFIRPQVGGAVCLGSDNFGVFEYQVDFEVFIKK